MKKLFKIYKEGKTFDWVTILIPESEFTAELREKKIKFYLELGYQIQLIND
jgi:hypothetical protein